MNYIQSKLEESFSDRIIDIPISEADNEFMEVKIEFSFNPIFTREIQMVFDDPVLGNTLEAISECFKAISKKIPKEFCFIRPKFMFKPKPRITLIGSVKVKKK